MTKATPKARAGLMQAELMGPSSHMSSVIATGTQNGFSLPQPLSQHAAVRALKQYQI